MTKYNKAVSVCFSGHRSVPFAKRRELKQCLKSEIAKAYADGYRYFYCGMAMGFDLLAAEAALSLQSELKDLQVIAVVPFRGQSDRWSKEEQAKYDANATTQMGLEAIMLNEINQTQKHKYCMTSLICGI